MGGVHSFYSFHSMIFKKNHRITRINANKSGAFRVGRIFPRLSVFSVAPELSASVRTGKIELPRRKSFLLYIYFLFDFFDIAVKSERTGRGVAWMRGVHSFYSFHSMIFKKSHRITRMKANKCGAFRAGRIFRGYPNFPSFPWYMNVEGALRHW
jgi:hypothetical protein